MSALSAIQENEPGGEVSEIFAEIQRELGIPFVERRRNRSGLVHGEPTMDRSVVEENRQVILRWRLVLSNDEVVVSR